MTTATDAPVTTTTTDADVLNGGPGADGTTAPGAAPVVAAAPELVDVRIGNRTYKMPKADAAEFQAANQPPAREPAPRREAAPRQSEQPKRSDRLFTETDEVLDEMVQEAVAKAVTHVTNAYQRDQGQKAFWDTFDRTYPDLKDDRDIAEMVLTANLQNWKDLSPELAQKALANEARQRVAKIMERSGGKGGAKPVTEAGGGAPRSRAAANSDPAPDANKPKTLGDIMRAKRQKFYNPQAPSSATH
jgi:hypothetical protein